MIHLQKNLFVKQNTVPSTKNIQIPKTRFALSGEIDLIFSCKRTEVKPVCFPEVQTNLQQP